MRKVTLTKKDDVTRAAFNLVHAQNDLAIMEDRDFPHDFVPKDHPLYVAYVQARRAYDDTIEAFHG